MNFNWEIAQIKQMYCQLKKKKKISQSLSFVLIQMFWMKEEYLN